MEWYRNLQIVLSTEDKLPFLEQPIPTLLVPPAGQANPSDVVTPHQAWVKAQKEIARLMLMTMNPYIQKNMEHLGTYDMLKELKTLSRPSQDYPSWVLEDSWVWEQKVAPEQEVENQLGKTSKSLRFDHEGEYTSQEFLDHLRDHGIIAHRNPPYTPQHNGMSERRNRTLLYMVRSMMSQITLPKSFWDYALESATRILNMAPTKKVDKTPYEVWHGQSPKLSYLKVWGCEALVKLDTLTKPDKLDCVGSRKNIPELLSVSLQDTQRKRSSGSLEDLEIIKEEDTHPSLDTSLNHEEDDQEIYEPQSDINPIRRSTRTRCAPDRMCLYIDAEEHVLGDLGEPANYKAALLDPESDKWLNAMNVEMQSMKDNEVWKLVNLLPNGKTVDIRAIRILIAITAFYDYEIWQMDVKTFFLNGYLNEEVYMEQPEGFVSQRFPNRISQNRDEPCVYVKASGSYVTFLILYVDDILIMRNNIPMLQDVESYLRRCFEMKDLGEAAYILGIKIYRDRSKRLIGLCQSAYIEKILKRYYMKNSKRGTILMQEKLKFSKSQDVLVLMLRFTQNITSRFQQNPGTARWTAFKNIMKYLCNTNDMFLVYGDSNSTLKNHISHPHCEALKRVSESGQSSMSRDESIFVYNPDVLREQFTAAKQSIIDGFANLNIDVNLTTDVWSAPHGVFGSYICVTAHLIEPVTLDNGSNNTSAFSTSGRVLSIRRARLTLASLEMCMCLKDHLDAQERKQHKSGLENPIDFEEEILDAEVQQNEAISLSEEEIALDVASSEGTMSGSGSGGEEVDYDMTNYGYYDYE
nr:hypothetical protein [Tanacetum cinerariifolium]